MRAYLEQFMCQEAVATQQSGPRPLPGTNLTLPFSSNPLDYASVVKALPDVDSPSLFGLPANVNRAVGRANGVAVITQLKQITASQVKPDRVSKHFLEILLTCIGCVCCNVQAHSDRCKWSAFARLGYTIPEYIVSKSGDLAQAGSSSR